MADGLLREDGGKLLTEDGGSILLAPVVVIPPPQHVARTVPRRIPKLQFRRGNTAEWATANPVLAQGEPGVDLDTGDFKIGDGATAWNSLPLPYAPLSFQTSAPRGVVATGVAFDPVTIATAGAQVDLTGSIRYEFDPTRLYRINYTIRAMSGAAAGKVAGTLQFWLWNMITGQNGVDQIVATDTAYYSGAAYTFLFTANGLMELRIRTSTYGNVMTIYGRDYYIEDIGAL